MWNDGTYLAHHGIKGQRWGIRRYQNEDGSLTSAGKQRYGYSGNVRDVSKKEYAKDRKKRIAAEAEAIKNSKVSNREKAKALSKLGAHSESADYYRKDFINKKRAVIIGNLAYAVGSKLASQALANAVSNGKMSFETGASIAKAVKTGKDIANIYAGAVIMSDIKKHNKEYWKIDG
jgi:hypothetical protein